MRDSFFCIGAIYAIILVICKLLRTERFRSKAVHTHKKNINSINLP
jgi:hypothetical protein